METLQKKSLFWDVSAPDPKKDADFIIGRILNLGDTDDFEWAMHLYGQDKVETVLREKAQLDKKSLSFLVPIFSY